MFGAVQQQQDPTVFEDGQQSLEGGEMRGKGKAEHLCHGTGQQFRCRRQGLQRNEQLIAPTGGDHLQRQTCFSNSPWSHQRQEPNLRTVQDACEVLAFSVPTHEWRA